MNKKLCAALLAAACAGVLMMKDGGPSVKNLHNPGTVIAALGDSLTAGYGAPAGQSYPDVLAQKTAVPVVNFGRNGDTAEQGLARLQDALDARPYMVLIEFGGNDFMRGVPPARTLAAVEEMTDRVLAAGAVAVIVDTGGYPGMRAYGKAYKKMAEEKDAVFVPGILDGIFGKSRYKADTVHPNAAGYKIVAERVYKSIHPYLK